MSFNIKSNENGSSLSFVARRRHKNSQRCSSNLALWTPPRDKLRRIDRQEDSVFWLWAPITESTNCSEWLTVLWIHPSASKPIYPFHQSVWISVPGLTCVLLRITGCPYPFYCRDRFLIYKFRDILPL